MNKHIPELYMHTEEGSVFLQQDDENQQNNRVEIASDQIDLVISWLQEAKAEFDRGESQ